MLNRILQVAFCAALFCGVMIPLVADAVPATGNGVPLVYPPQVIQFVGCNAVTATTTCTPNQTAGTGTGHVLVCGMSDLIHTPSTPTGYTQLGTTNANSVQLALYYRSPPTGTSGDNCVLGDGSATAKAGFLIELANAGTPTGYSGQAQASSALWFSPTIAATTNDLLLTMYVANATASSVAFGSIGWSATSYNPTATAGQVFGVHTIPALWTLTYQDLVTYATAQAGVDAIIRIPTNGD